MLKLKLQYLGHLMWRNDSLEKTLMLGKIEVRKISGWDGRMASPTRWTWTWASSRSWWWTGKPGKLQSMRSQSQMWLNWTDSIVIVIIEWANDRYKYICIYTHTYIHTYRMHLNHAWHTVAAQELVPATIGSVFPGTLVVKNLPVNTGDIRDMDWIPGSGRSPGRGHGNPLQYSCLESPHGQRRLVHYSPWGLKESDTIEVT